MKSTEEFSKELFDKWGLALISEYTGAHKPVNFTCANGHTNTAAATNALQRGYKCKECLTGRVVVSKFEWNDSNTKQVLDALKVYSTKEVAEKFNITIPAINNRLAKLNISNPRDRFAERNLVNVLLHQDRELISLIGDLATIRCAKGHTHVQTPSNIMQHNSGCPSCFSAYGESNIELEIREFIASVYTGWTVYKDRTILNGKELDIVLPDLGLAIEINGTYWHREEKVGRTYHLDKTEDVEAFGYQLLHIKDYDWYVKSDIVKSMIRSKIGVTNKIFARKCFVRQITFPGEFLNANHIQGAGQPTSLNYGLFSGQVLVAVATFSKPRFSDEADLELVRFCSLLNTTVIGGLSKLLSKVRGSILSYANRDYSNGRGYLATGFKLLRKTEPGIEYYKRYVKVSRYKAQSMEPEELLKYSKYFTSGNLLFIKA